MVDENKEYSKVLSDSTLYGRDIYYVTEMDRLDYQGSAIANALLTGNKLKDEYNELKEMYTKFHWHSVTLDELFDILNQDSEVIIVVSSKAKAYKKAIENKYPQSITMNV